MDLVYKHEKRLFVITAVISAIVWLGVLVGTFGLLLVYLLVMYLFFLFAHSVFITYLKGTGVKITAEQYPDLHASLVASCEKVGVKKVPDAYLLRTDFFNALATRFLGRNFIVLFTDVVDALESRPEAVNFYIGHELGHIHRKHLLWGPVLLPGAILPILGPALKRAEEYTCDRYGVACCHSTEDVQAALAAIAAGDTRWKHLNADAYIKQAEETGGFWMSFHELTGDYPWLTKRMATALALMENRSTPFPRRNIFAWILALFVPRFGVGGASSLLITVMLVIGLGIAAKPSYDAYKERVRYSLAYTAALPVKEKVADYARKNSAWPLSLQEIGYGSESIDDLASEYSIMIYNSGMIGVHMGIDEAGEARYIVLKPVVEQGDIVWSCFGQNAQEEYLPAECL